jgi:hypothetical protein
MAFTGSIRAAINAGMMPARIPVIIQATTAPTKRPNEINTSKSK